MYKLLQICVEGNRGSTGTMAEAIGSYVIEKGWESTICFGRFPRPSNSNLIAIGSRMEIFVHGLWTRIFDRHGLGSSRATKRLIKQIDAIKPDIIQLHHLHGYYINIEVLFDYLKSKSIPVIWIFHDCWSFTGHCTNFDYVGCSKWMTECGKCPQLQEYPASYLIDASTKNFHLKKKLFNQVQNLTIVTVSNWLNNTVGKSFLSSINRVMIYNGIDTSTFKNSENTDIIRQKYNLIDKFVILGVASPWSDKKGLNDFLEFSKMIDSDCIIVMVGLDKEQIKKMPHNVVGVSRLENAADLNSIYSISDIYFNLSVEETFGLTTVEALSSGTPVLLYNRTASPELVDTETGFVVDKQDYQAMLKAIKTIKKNTKAYYAEKCRSRAVKYFERSKMLANYYKLYNTVLTKNN
jgi:putative colanic acid biosynthesis glycosyltransferase